MNFLYSCYLDFLLPDTIDKIIECLTVVNYMPDRMYCGWNNIEIADALNRIAVNDDNKKMVSVKTFRTFKINYQIT